jgi:hypothetical protein
MAPRPSSATISYLPIKVGAAMVWIVSTRTGSRE